MTLSDLIDVLAFICLVFVFAGIIPVISSFTQYLLIGLHGITNHYSECKDYTPKVSIVIPAWDEGDVIGASIDSLMSLAYPEGAWRIYVVDDASTDQTPDVLRKKMLEYPGSVFHLRREVGGQGKAHALNHGLSTILADDWAEAILIMDADVLFEPLTLRRMTRHLADKSIGAVTAYVKEGSEPGNLVTRFVAYEYIAAQAAARRAQNVIGVLACLAGGAQLHSRTNLVEMGGLIDTTSLAEDTFTTFKTQLNGRRVMFDGNAVVWAEEPDTLEGLWKQRLRWARGNIQLTVAFRHVWFRPHKNKRLGSAAFGILWFSILLMPLFMIAASIGLLGLHWLRPNWEIAGFATLWGTASAVYVFERLFSYVIDPTTAARTWLEGFLFPGLISLVVAAVFFLPQNWFEFLDVPVSIGSMHSTWREVASLMSYAWISLCMVAAWGVYALEKRGLWPWLRNMLLIVVGYGPVLTAISIAAMVAEWKKTDLRWDKTLKTGRARIPT